jgi:hypothetical protein
VAKSDLSVWFICLVKLNILDNSRSTFVELEIEAPVRVEWSSDCVINMALQLFVGAWRLFQFPNLIHSR